jgi:plasmid stabilization system protein ParE
VSFNLYFTKEAKETFQSICSQIEERWGEKQLDKFKIIVSESLDNLCRSPKLYPLVSKKHPSLRKYIFHKNCSIFFKIVDSDNVHIICFWDNRQEPLF